MSEAKVAGLDNKAGQRFPGLSGMLASVEIKTGQKSVLDYLMKAPNKMSEVPHEREKRVRTPLQRRGAVGAD